jgi:hypothetical protein
MSETPWSAGTQAADRVPPRDCIRAARDALSKAYSHPGISDGRHALGFIAEAVDWQRRALEQMVETGGEPS